ncbi:MAG TPA: hypothetical protein VGN51_00025 [Acidimicrobiia bacterium]|jgi:hypothetical protein
MADDERSPEGPDPQVGAWLEVEPLDEVARRRLVSTAMSETGMPETGMPETRRPPRTWRWIAAAAAVVVVAVGTVAVVTANGGHDEPQATRERSTALAPKALEQELAAAPDVGDFGDLDDAKNLAALRTALGESFASSAAAPQVAAGTASDSSRSGTATPTSGNGCVRGVIGTVVAQGSGTIDGRPVTVLLIEGADGARSLGAMFLDSCGIRDLGSG